MENKKGILKAFDVGTYKATVKISGSLSSWLDGIAVARDIAAAEMVAGRKCALVFFDEANPLDAVLIAVYV